MFFVAFLLSVHFLASCGKDDVDNSSTQNTTSGASTEKVVNTLSVGDFSITKDNAEKIQTDLLISLKGANKDFDKPVVITETTLLKNKDNNYLLRTQYDNGYTSTTLLSVATNRGGRVSAVVAKTSCTSTSCSSGGGCQPEINGYCSACSKGTKDCTRTTTSGGRGDEPQY